MTTSHKILVAEDDNLLMGAVSEKLLHEGFAVIKAANGLEALNSALKDRPDLILLDYMLPKMDGISVLKKLRQDGWGSSCPVIMFTNASDSQVLAEALQGGAFDYLVKSDTTITEVVNKIRQKLGIPA